MKVRTFGDSMLDGILKLLVLVLAFVFAYPFLYSLSVSFSDPMAVARLEVKLFPVGFSLGAYELVFRSERLWRAYRNTVLYTGVGTFVRVLLLIITAYPLSRKRFPGRTFFTFAYTFTMLFGGGLIPSYLVVRGVVAHGHDVSNYHPRGTGGVLHHNRSHLLPDHDPNKPRGDGVDRRGE